MTCIAAIKEKGIVYMGGDSAGVCGLDVRLRADKKVFKKGEFVFGFTSSFRMGQLLRFNLELPYHKAKISDEVFINTVFIEAIRKCLKEGGYAWVKENIEHGGMFIVGYRGEIYTIESDYQVARHIENYDACGCGQDYALTTFFALRKSKLKPRAKIKAALEAAVHFSGGVRPPFVFVNTK